MQASELIYYKKNFKISIKKCKLHTLLRMLMFPVRIFKALDAQKLVKIQTASKRMQMNSTKDISLRAL